VQWGTGEPCLTAALKMLEIKGGTVVLWTTVWPCQVAGRGCLVLLHGFAGLCCFCIFLFGRCV